MCQMPRGTISRTFFGAADLNFDMAKVFEKLARLNLIEAFLEMDDEMLQKILLLL